MAGLPAYDKVYRPFSPFREAGQFLEPADLPKAPHKLKKLLDFDTYIKDIIAAAVGTTVDLPANGGNCVLDIVSRGNSIAGTQ